MKIDKTNLDIVEINKRQLANIFLELLIEDMISIATSLSKVKKLDDKQLQSIKDAIKANQSVELNK